MTKTPPELTVIVVSYNTRELTLTALRSLYATTKETPFRCVVFDNASKDGSAEAIREQLPDVSVIESPDNLGFAAANNRVADMVETEWLLLLNPDTEVYEGAVDNLMAFARSQPEAGIYGGRTVFPDGSLNIASCWKKITPWSAFCAATGLRTLFQSSSFFNPEAYGGWRRDTVRNVDIVVGCFFLIRRALWNDLGGFNLKYKMYGEEADLCLRAAQQGYRPMITPDAEIMHIVGASSATRSEKQKLSAAGRSTLIRDHFPGALVPWGIAMMWLWGWLRFATSQLGRFSPRQKDRDRALHWARVWVGREEWLRGYVE